MKELNGFVKYILFLFVVAVLTILVLSIQPFARDNITLFIFLWISTPILGWLLRNPKIDKYLSLKVHSLIIISLIAFNFILFFSWIVSIDKIHFWIVDTIFNETSMESIDTLNDEKEFYKYQIPLYSNWYTRISLILFDLIILVGFVFSPSFLFVRLLEALKKTK